MLAKAWAPDFVPGDNDALTRALEILTRERAHFYVPFGRAWRLADQATRNRWQFAQPKISNFEQARAVNWLLKILAQLRQVEMREKIFTFNRQRSVNSVTPRVGVGHLQLEENWDHPFASRSLFHRFGNRKVYAFLRFIRAQLAQGGTAIRITGQGIGDAVFV